MGVELGKTGVSAARDSGSSAAKLKLGQYSRSLLQKLPFFIGTGKAAPVSMKDCGLIPWYWHDSSFSKTSVEMRNLNPRKNHHL